MNLLAMINPWLFRNTHAEKMNSNHLTVPVLLILGFSFSGSFLPFFYVYTASELLGHEKSLPVI